MVINTAKRVHTQLMVTASDLAQKGGSPFEIGHYLSYLLLRSQHFRTPALKTTQDLMASKIAVSVLGQVRLSMTVETTNHGLQCPARTLYTQKLRHVPQ